MDRDVPARKPRTPADASAVIGPRTVIWACLVAACSQGAAVDTVEPEGSSDAGAVEADAGDTASCGSSPCAEGETCIEASCVDERCAHVRCSAGTACIQGECVDPAADAGAPEPVIDETADAGPPPEPADAGTTSDAGSEASIDAGTPYAADSGSGGTTGNPTCALAGGNTCTDASTTLCSDLPAIASSDCAICCQRPADPPLWPASFQIVHKDFYTHWDAIDGLGARLPYVLIASQNRPAQVPALRWSQNITTEYGYDEGMLVPFHSGAEIAAFIHRMLQKGEAGPRFVMIDELRDGVGTSTQTLVHDCAVELATRYPQWRGRWGAYVVNGPHVAYTGLNDDGKPAIDALLDAGAILAAEMYARRVDYCNAGSTTAARDAWLADFFHGSRGSFPQARFHWLAQRKVARRSTSQLSILFGVTDGYMTGTGPAVFLDRMFYVWRTRSGYPSVLLPNGGGVGSWKWQDQSPTSRDLAFAQSFEHYVVQGRTNSLKGAVSCP